MNMVAEAKKTYRKKNKTATKINAELSGRIQNNSDLWVYKREN